MEYVQGGERGMGGRMLGGLVLSSAFALSTVSRKLRKKPLGSVSRGKLCSVPVVRNPSYLWILSLLDIWVGWEGSYEAWWGGMAHSAQVYNILRFVIFTQYFHINLILQLLQGYTFFPQRRF